MALLKSQKPEKKGILMVVTLVANDSIKLSPKLTGNNARSIKFEIGPGKPIAQGVNGNYVILVAIRVHA